MKYKLFGSRIEPACEYCDKGKATKDKQMILCPKHGAVYPYYSCRSFTYSPLLRIPKPLLKLKKYSDDDFKL